MPHNTPLRLARPRECPKCKTLYCVLPMTLVLDGQVDLAWFCRQCRHEWPIDRSDAIDPREKQMTQ